MNTQNWSRADCISLEGWYQYSGADKTAKLLWVGGFCEGEMCKMNLDKIRPEMEIRGSVGLQYRWKGEGRFYLRQFMKFLPFALSCLHEFDFRDIQGIQEDVRTVFVNAVYGIKAQICVLHQFCLHASL